MSSCYCAMMSLHLWCKSCCTVIIMDKQKACRCFSFLLAATAGKMHVIFCPRSSNGCNLQSNASWIANRVIVVRTEYCLPRSSYVCYRGIYLLFSKFMQMTVTRAFEKRIWQQFELCRGKRARLKCICRLRVGESLKLSNAVHRTVHKRSFSSGWGFTARHKRHLPVPECQFRSGVVCSCWWQCLCPSTDLP